MSPTDDLKDFRTLVVDYEPGTLEYLAVQAERTGNGRNAAVEGIKTRQVESFKGFRILLAEDVEINREIVLALLEPTGIEIDCAANGLEAVELFGTSPERYDMIFMDVQMPEMDGLTATQRIRSLEIKEAGRIPIVAMTANVFREDVEKCIEAGMNDHIGKPIDYDDMLKSLRKYLRAK